MQVIETDEDIARGVAWLSAREPRLAEAAAEAGPIPLRRQEGGFEGLLLILVSQQLSVAAANGIWGRMQAAGATTPQAILSASEDELRAHGLSRPKARYARAIAEADLDYGALAALPPEEATATLTAIKGVGPWTAEIYLMFSVGHADVFAAGDLALQESAKVLFALPERPDAKAMAAMAEDWSPWRAVAARILWSYYRLAKGREGVST